MSIRLIRQFILYLVALFLALVLAGCGNTPAATVPEPSEVIGLSTPATVTPGMTETPQPTAAPNTRTPRPTFDLTADFLTNPPPTPTGTPVMDANGNVTWHSEEKLISFSASGGDGVFYAHNYFTLFWNGTLILSSNIDGNGIPYFVKLSNDEVCKILNTADASGFFEAPHWDNFPFQGLGFTGISVKGWKSNDSGTQILASAIAGRPYYDNLFCRECPIPSQETIIHPGLATMYYFLQNYHPPQSQKIPVDEISVDFGEAPAYVDKNQVSEWQLTSITEEAFIERIQDCYQNKNCGGHSDNAVFRGEQAKEIMTKLGNGGVFQNTAWGGDPAQVFYAPKAPDMPSNHMLTCNTQADHYPILPLNKNNKFWYYAPGGKWGAERVEGQNRMRVVNTSGYEKFYQYDPTLFGQPSIQFYPRFWSADEQFFYVNILPGDYKPNVSLENSIGLEQIDVKKEKIKYLFLGTKGETFAYELSKDGKQVAYIRQGDSPLKLVVANTASGEERAVSLIRSDGSPYTSAGTLFWSYDDNSIFLAASYTENGTEKTDFLATNPGNLALRIIYTADALMKLRESFSYSVVDICPILTGGDGNCQIDLDMDTGEIQDSSK